MTHEVESIAYAGAMPWHGLGAKVDPNSTPDEMLKAAGLDWEIERTYIYARRENTDGTTEDIRIPGRRAMIRSSDKKVLTIAGQDWKPLQNKSLLNFFKEYSEAGGAALETAGSLRGGTIVWALASLNHGFSVGGKNSQDKVNGYLLFTSPHRVGSSITIRTTTVRVVCANTMAMAEREGGVEYKQNHMTHFDWTAAKVAVERAHECLSLAAKRAETIHNLKVSTTDRLRFLGKFFLPNVDQLKDADLMAIAQANTNGNTFYAVNQSVEHAPGAEPETGWGIMNGVTHWADHVNGRSAASRMFRSWIGDVSRTKLAVEKGLLTMAG